MTKPTILVTGGAGYIGSHVNKRLLQAGYSTIILDNLSQGHKEAVIGGEFVEGDIADRSLLDSLLSSRPIGGVIHLAASIKVGESVTHPDKYYRNNVAGSLALLEALAAHKVGNLVFSSTAAVYGQPENLPVHENDRIAPINPYGRTKQMVETMLSDFNTAYGMRSSSLRYFNAAGGDPEGEIKNYNSHPQNLIPIVLQALKESKEVAIFGTDYDTNDGTCVRDYIHVWDLAEAHLLALENLLDGAPSSRYNLGNGRGFSVREVIQAAEKVTGITPKVVEQGRRAGDPPALTANATSAKTELGWTPQYPDLETIVRDAWNAQSQTIPR